MANVNVTYQEMRDAAGRLRNGQTDMESTLNELSSLINGLVGSGFVTDQASGAYQAQFEQFTSGTQQAIAGLEGLSQFLTSAADALENTDNQLASQISG